MHDTAYETGKKFFELYWKPSFKKILDLGSQNINGTLRDFCPEGAEYLGIDMSEGEGVDFVLSDPYQFPFENESFDVIVSSSCFEHTTFFWVTFIECIRVLKREGFLYINAPSNGVYHPYPTDCWRFYPDAAWALAEWSQKNGYDAVSLESFTCFRKDDIWNDFVAVFGKDLSILPSRVCLSDLCSPVQNVYKGDRTRMLNLSSSTEDMARLEESKREIVSLNQLISDRDNLLAELKETLSAREATLSDLNKTLQDQHNLLVELKKTLSARESAVSDLNKTL